MTESYSVKAILSAEDSSFRSVFNNAQGILSRFSNSSIGGVTQKLSNLKSMVNAGLGFGVMSGIGQQAFGIVSKAVSGLTSNLGGAISRYDTLKTFPRVMEQMGFKTETTKKASEKLVAAIDGLPTSLDRITANTQNIALVTGNLDKATDTTIALNNAFLMSGSSTAEAERGLTQYVQMMSAGKVDMQSWRTLLETMSPALTKVAESFGYTGESAKVDLYEALKSGKITFDEFNNRLIEMNEGMDISGKHFDGFAKLAKTSTDGIGTNIENLKLTVVKQMEKMIGAFDDAGLSIAASLYGIKVIINDTMNKFRESNAFQAIIDSATKTKEALIEAFNNFAHSDAMKTAKEQLNIIAKNLGVILPNVIRALNPVFEALVTVVSKVFGAISTLIAKVTSDPAFQRFAETIAKAMTKIGDVVARVIKKLEPFITLTLNYISDIIDAFGEAFDAIVNSAKGADTAGKMYNNFKSVLDVVRGALLKVADFLKNHHSLILWLIEHLPTIIALIGGIKIALLAMEKIKAFAGLVQDVTSFVKNIQNASSKVGDFVSNIFGLFSKVKDAGGSFTNFASVAQASLGNVNTYVSQSGDAIYGIAGKFTHVNGTAQNACETIKSSFSGVASAAANTGEEVASGIGGGMNTAASTAGSAASSIIGTIGGIAAGVGAAVGIITGIVTAIQKWREEQYKAGQEAAQFTEAQQAVIDKNTELISSYDSVKESTANRILDAEAEAEKAYALGTEYEKLIDTHGNVIQGKEKEAEVIRGKLFEAMGIEEAKVNDLRSEYLGLIDENGNVIEGYENRAEEIKKALSDILGVEITNGEQIKNIDGEVIKSKDELIEKMRLEAEAAVLSDAFIESAKKKRELADEELEMIDALRIEQEKYHNFLHEHGVEREEDLHGLSAAEKGYFEGVQGNLEELEKSLEKNRDKQVECERDKQLATEATVAAANEDYGTMRVLLDQYEGDLITASDAVNKYNENAMLKLQEQANNADAQYQRIKAAADKGEQGVTKTQVEESKARADFAKKQLDTIYNDTNLHYQSTLRNQMDTNYKAYQEAKAHYEKVNKMSEEERRRNTDSDLQEAKKRLDNAYNNYRKSEEDYNTYLDGMNRTGSEKLATLTAMTDSQTKDAANKSVNNLNTGMQNTQGKLESFKTPFGKSMYGVLTAMNAQFANLPSLLNVSTMNGLGGMSKALAFLKPQITASAASIKWGINDNIKPVSTYAYGKFVISGLNSGMWGMAGVVYGTAAKIASNVASRIRAALQINSPSKLTTKYGEYVVQGLINGLKDNSNKVERVAEDLADRSTKALDNIVAFPTVGNLQKELNTINARNSLDINTKTLEDIGQTIDLQANLIVDSRPFAQTLTSNMSRAQYEAKRRRRA